MKGFRSESKALNSSSEIYKDKYTRNRNSFKIKEKEYINTKENNINNNFNSKTKYNKNIYFSSNNNINFN